MNETTIESKARSTLAYARFMLKYTPFGVTNWFLKRSLRFMKLDKNTTRHIVSAKGVPCEWIIPDNQNNNHVLLYLHGGGFVFGLTNPHLKMISYLAQKMRIRILVVDYRLAPAFPFPAALDDCLIAYHWLLEQGILAKNIVVGGDSAGGNLTVSLLMKLRDLGEILPSAAACLSPVTDLHTTDHLRPGFKDPILPIEVMELFTKAYLSNNNAHDPLISPVFGNLSGLPPMIIHVGDDEILREDAIRLANLAKSCGVEVQLHIYPRMWHVWQVNLELSQAINSLKEITDFLVAHLESDA